MCAGAKVEVPKVLPQNLRGLFARTYYKRTPNLAELTNLMGNSDVNTTRTYVTGSRPKCRGWLDALRPVR